MYQLVKAIRPLKLPTVDEGSEEALPSIQFVSGKVENSKPTQTPIAYLPKTHGGARLYSTYNTSAHHPLAKLSPHATFILGFLEVKVERSFAP